MYICIYICTYVYIYMYIPYIYTLHISIYMYIWIGTYIHTYIHTCIHTYIHTYIHTEELHWLPMQKRIEFKILMLMRNGLAGCAPIYLRELCVPVSSVLGRRSLRSATQGDLVVPMARTSTMLHKSFAVVGPSFWNRLPCNLRNELLGLSVPLFRKRLKTILFN